MKATVNILLVDDKPTNLMALEAILESPDLKLVKATSGNEALTYLLEMDFACVLLDVKIPDIDGFELAQIIRRDKRTRHLPLLFLSGHRRNEEDVQRGYELGAVDYLLKPVEPAIVRGKVNVFADVYRRELGIREAENFVRRANEELESRVAERTSALQAQTTKLERSNAELAQFAYISSHDLREPLRMLAMYVELMEKRFFPGLDSEARDYAGIIVESAHRMQSLIEDLFTYSSLGNETQRAAEVDMAVSVSDALADLKWMIDETKTEIKVGPLPKVKGEPTELRRLWRNLVGNAIKFRSEEAPVVRIDAAQVNNEYLFSVRDNGIGIDPRYKDKVFQIFQRLHPRDRYPGTGMGLAVCKKIIELHNGRIWLDCDASRGATFHFNLPILSGEAK